MEKISPHRQIGRWTFTGAMSGEVFYGRSVCRSVGGESDGGGHCRMVTAYVWKFLLLFGTAQFYKVGFFLS